MDVSTCSALSPDKENRSLQQFNSQLASLGEKQSGWVMRDADTATGSGDSSTHNDDLEKHTADDTPIETGRLCIRSPSLRYTALPSAEQKAFNFADL